VPPPRMRHEEERHRPPEKLPPVEHRRRPKPSPPEPIREAIRAPQPLLVVTAPEAKPEGIAAELRRKELRREELRREELRREELRREELVER
jgi:hypothetical protein